MGWDGRDVMGCDGMGDVCEGEKEKRKKKKKKKKNFFLHSALHSGGDGQQHPWR